MYIEVNYDARKGNWPNFVYCSMLSLFTVVVRLQNKLSCYILVFPFTCITVVERGCEQFGGEIS